MYSDQDPCAVCGAEVRLLANPGSSGDDLGGPAGPRDGFVGGGDDPVDVRRCTDDDCESRRPGGPDA